METPYHQDIQITNKVSFVQLPSLYQSKTSI